MVVDSNASNFHEMEQEFLRWLPVQVANNKRVRLDIGYELLLLFKDILEIL